VRHTNAAWIVSLLLLLIAPPLVAPLAASVEAKQNRLVDLVSTEAVLRWINAYRTRPEPMGMPPAVHALSRFGAFKDPENAGVYIGFMAGIIGSNPEIADKLIAKSLPLPHGDQWALVRAIAYSGHPEWRNLLRRYAAKLPARKVLIDKYLAGELPKLYDFEPEPHVSAINQLHNKIWDKKPPKAHVLEFSPELLDTYWGHYFATGHARPILRIVDMLPLSKDAESVEKLTLGSMAKFTLASNASRDPTLLALLRASREGRPKQVATVLGEVIDAAETVEMTRLRKEAMASIEELRRKGPDSRRKMSMWGQIGQGALALGCIGAAAAGAVALGLPCVIGGGVSSAALSYWEKNQ
jgi:hypothetical protein